MKIFMLTWLERELADYRLLPVPLRAMLRSVFFHYLAFPVVMVFMNTFLLRQAGVEAILLYNAGFYLSIPVVFVTNNYLWRWLSIKWLYFLGAVGQGLVVFLVMFANAAFPLAWISFGTLMGVPVGLYFANRNFLELSLTNDANRNYFGGLKSLLSTLTGVAMPMIIGGFIKLGSIMPWYSVEIAYRTIAVISLILLLMSGWLLRRVRVDTPQVSSFFGLRRTKKWFWALLSGVGWGFFNAIDFILPSIIVFELLGSEGTLGLLLSAGALIGAVILFYIGKRLQPGMRISLVGMAVVVMSLVTVMLSWWYVPAVAVVTLMVLTTGSRTGWSFREPVIMKQIDVLSHHSQVDKNVYLLDTEMALGVGRMLALGLFGSILVIYGEQYVARLSLLLGAAALLLMQFSLMKFDRVMTARPQN